MGVWAVVRSGTVWHAVSLPPWQPHPLPPGHTILSPTSSRPPVQERQPSSLFHDASALSAQYKTHANCRALA